MPWRSGWRESPPDNRGLTMTTIGCHAGWVRRELQIIRDDLHCNAVKICGRDIDRLTFAAETALELGLEVWFSPELWDKDPGDTMAHILAAAQAAERLRRRQPERLVFSVAT